MKKGDIVLMPFHHRPLRNKKQTRTGPCRRGIRHNRIIYNHPVADVKIEPTPVNGLKQISFGKFPFHFEQKEYFNRKFYPKRST